MPKLDQEILQLPHVLLATGTAVGFLILTVETFYSGFKMSKLRRGGRSLAALLLALLAAGLSTVLILYIGKYYDKLNETVNNLKPEEGEATRRFAYFVKSSNPGCFTQDLLPQPCILPFTYQDQVYSQCANQGSVKWCSTETDEDNNHVESSWVEGRSTAGWCSEDCPACRTGTGANCRLPFDDYYNKFTYSACTTHDGDDPWCDTANSWGYCIDSCTGGNNIRLIKIFLHINIINIS